MAYQAAVFTACEEKKQRFPIGADLNAEVKAAIAGIPEVAWMKWRDAGIAETVHSMTKIQRAVRLILVRRPRQAICSTQTRR